MNFNRKLALRSLITVAVVVVAWSAYTYVRISSKIEKQELACFDELANILDAGANPLQEIQQQFDELQLLVEKSLVIRSEMLEIANRLRLNTDEPLSSRDLVTIKSGSEYYLGLREGLYEIAHAYECAAEAQPATLEKFGISPELRCTTTTCWRSFFSNTTIAFAG